MEKPDQYNMVFFDAKEKVVLLDKRMERLVEIRQGEGYLESEADWCGEGEGQAGEEEVLPASQVQGALGTDVASLGGEE